MWSFDQVGAVLGAIGMAAARGEEFDRGVLGSELDLAPVHRDELIQYVDRIGLAWIAPVDDPEPPSFLTRGGAASI